MWKAAGDPPECDSPFTTYSFRQGDTGSPGTGERSLRPGHRAPHPGVRPEPGPLILGAMAEGSPGHAYVGMRALRREDARLLAGRGRFVGSVRLPGMLHAVLVRSQIAHGRPVGCDVGSAGPVEGGAQVITPSSAPGRRWRCVRLPPGQR